MRSISARSWVLVILSAALQLLSFPLAGPLPIWRSMFCWIALVPFLLALLERDDSGKWGLRQAFYLGYLCGFLWYVGNCYWIYQTMYLYGGLPKAISFGILILFALYLGLYHALFALCLIFSRRLGNGLWLRLCLVPFFWVTIELARAQVTGFPWDLLGYSQIDSALLTRLAPIAGVMGMSFLIAAVNAAFLPLFIGTWRRRWIAPGAAIIVVCIASLPMSAGFGRPQAARIPNAAVMMQENLEVGTQSREVTPMSEPAEIDSFAAATMQAARPQHDAIPTVIIWPEAPSHLRSDEPIFLNRMKGLAEMAQAPLIIGSLGVEFDRSSPRGYYLYDSASLFDASGHYQGRYDKIHLVPWGEYVPFKRFFAFAEKLTEGVGDMDPGHERRVFATGGHSYGVFVCYESIFGNEVREFAKNGAEVLVNISDDGWYGDTGAPWQHLNMARMRAIENHRWVLRSTNTGITTAIDPYGRTAYQAPRHVRGAFAFPFAFEPARELTIYTRFGDWFAWLCVVVSAAAIAAVWLRRSVIP